MFRSLPRATELRRSELASYLAAEVLEYSRFKCKHFGACKSSCAGQEFYEGQLSHVGKHYDLELNGLPLRIVIVGQEYGHKPAKVDMAARTEMILRHSHFGFQSSQRTTHMKGTASMLRLLMGREPGTDSAGERLMGNDHIYDGFALVNYLLCSATSEVRDDPTVSSKGAAKGKSSTTMQRNCARHFLNTLRILDPTVILIQGQGVRNWIATHIGIRRSNLSDESIVIDGNPIDTLAFDHPSAGGKSGWWGNSPNTRYLREVVRPSLQNYMRKYAA